MIIIRQFRIYRKDLKNNPQVLYIFGDNLSRKGLGGQAKEMRGEPNAFGIATKRSITHNYPEDYFFDHEKDVLEIIYEEFRRLGNFLNLSKKYEAVVIPSDGIGTGLAKLQEYAPNALFLIEDLLKKLEDI